MIIETIQFLKSLQENRLTFTKISARDNTRKSYMQVTSTQLPNFCEKTVMEFVIAICNLIASRCCLNHCNFQRKHAKIILPLKDNDFWETCFNSQCSISFLIGTIEQFITKFMSSYTLFNFFSFSKPRGWGRDDLQARIVFKAKIIFKEMCAFMLKRHAFLYSLRVNALCNLCFT